MNTSVVCVVSPFYLPQCGVISFLVAAQAQKHLHKGSQKVHIYINKVKFHQTIKDDLDKQQLRMSAPRMQHIQIGFYGDKVGEKRVSGGEEVLASAEEGEVAFLAAHLAAHAGHQAVKIPPA